MIHLLWASLLVPIIIHLAHRRRAKRLPFSTLHFLLAVDQRVARRHRLKELLLLATRVALLAALVGALERPMLRSSTFKGANVPTATAIVLDNTYSMRAADRGAVFFQNARRAVLDILDGLANEDTAAILLVDSGEAQAPQPTTDLAGLRKRVEQMEAGFGAGRLSGALRMALKSLDLSTNPRKELYIITDMQQVCWTEDIGDVGAEIPPEVPVFVVDVGAPVSHNLSLTRADAGLPTNVAGAAFRLYCTVTNQSSRSLGGDLSFFLEGEKLDSEAITLAPGANVTATFGSEPRKSGLLAGYVELEPDALDADNRRYFCLDVRRKIAVLLVNGRPSAVPYLDEVFYLQLALLAGRGQAASPIEVEVIGPDEFLRKSLSPYHCVILANVPRMTDQWAERLREHTMGGGGLIIFCGSQIDAASYNAALGGEPDDAVSLLPGRLDRPRSAKAEGLNAFRVERFNPDHPALRDVISGGTLRPMRIERFFAVEMEEGQKGVSKLLELDAGPLLLENKVGNGVVFLFTSSADISWSNLPVRPFFLPLLHQMVYYAAGSDGEELVTLVGMPYELELDGVADSIEVTFRLPDEEGKEEESTIVVTSELEQGRNTALFTETLRPGIYRAEYEVDGLPHVRGFAVNVDPQESNLSRLSMQEAAEMLPGGAFNPVPTYAELASIVRREREGLPLWDYLLMLVIAAAVIESFLGNVSIKH